MMERKKQFRYFTIFEYEKEQDYLREMHKKGWRFERVGGLGVYHFVKDEPADVVYQLDYNKEGLEHKEEYVKMFNDCGWEYLQEYAGYTYFRKAVSAEKGEEEIFCDNESRLQMMERVFKGRMVPVLVIFFTVLIPQFILNICVYHNYWLAGVFGAILGLYVAAFLACAHSYNKCKNNLK